MNQRILRWKKIIGGFDDMVVALNYKNTLKKSCDTYEQAFSTALGVEGIPILVSSPRGGMRSIQMLSVPFSHPGANSLADLLTFNFDFKYEFLSTSF